MNQPNLESKIIFGIGSNLGDRAHNIDLAIDKLTQYLQLKNLKKSSIYVNKAMLPKDAPHNWDIDFFNIAVLASINLQNFQPPKILQIIKKIENEIGRTNTQFWAPREIDIDILAIDKIFYQSEELIIPHIGLFDRDFFVKTVCEIDEDYFLELKNHFKR
ncbi:MAG: 2-amino-4-hydroxy-6-hydroxymethyldihydropteridine diphosphokinase [Rickettsiales bacterium]